MRGKAFIVLAILFLCACPTSAIIYFNDGQTHNIDYEINEGVYVDYQTPEMYTIINLLPDGSIPSPHWLQGFNQSQINISGGYIGNTRIYNSSQVNISGGSIGPFHSYNSSQIHISGGSIGGNLYSYDSSQIDIVSGSIYNFFVHDSSQVDISGGNMNRLYIYNSSYVNISGGSIRNSLYSYGSSYVNISGGSRGYLCSFDSSHLNISGSFKGSFSSYDSSYVYVSGGSIKGFGSLDSSRVNIFGGLIGGDLIDGDLGLYDQSIVQIFGFDFAVDDQPFGYGELTSIFGGSPKNEPLRYLTGTLLSGEFIDCDFQIGYDARIILIPEPASAIILGLGSLIVVYFRRRR